MTRWDQGRSRVEELIALGHIERGVVDLGQVDADEEDVLADLELSRTIVDTCEKVLTTLPEF